MACEQKANVATTDLAVRLDVKHEGWDHADSFLSADVALNTHTHHVSITGQWTPVTQQTKQNKNKNRKGGTTGLSILKGTNRRKKGD